MMEKDKRSKGTSLEKIREIKNRSRTVFTGTEFSENYRQKLCYRLLNTVKSNDQKEFFWTLSRALNAIKGENSAKLAEKLNEVYPLSSQDFEKLSYSIILGIISATGGE